MIEDVTRIVKECLTCQRHQKIRPLNHPAKALEVDGVFDRVGIDLVFGLPPTEEGFKGVVVFTEYLTKYPYAAPIKSKSAEEIAEHFLTYISFFGPPKVLLSDQGLEFNNRLIDGMMQCIGVEHRVTSKNKWINRTF